MICRTPKRTPYATRKKANRGRAAIARKRRRTVELQVYRCVGHWHVVRVGRRRR